MVPVGQETLGRIMNVIGEPVDERGPIDSAAKVKRIESRVRYDLTRELDMTFDFVDLAIDSTRLSNWHGSRSDEMRAPSVMSYTRTMIGHNNHHRGETRGGLAAKSAGTDCRRHTVSINPLSQVDSSGSRSPSPRSPHHGTRNVELGTLFISA